MTERSGAVRVRENHVGTSLPTNAIDGEVVVDLDAETPHVSLPPEVGAIYDAEQADGGRAATDGGQPTVAEREVETAGYGLAEENAMAAAVFGGLGLFAGGWIVGQDGVAAVGVLLGGLAAFALYIGTRAYWGESP